LIYGKYSVVMCLLRSSTSTHVAYEIRLLMLRTLKSLVTSASLHFDVRGRTCLTANAFTRVPVEIHEEQGACGCILMNSRKNESQNAISREQSVTVGIDKNDESQRQIRCI